MALQAVEADLPLSLDDFIPPHLQKKQRASHNDTPRQVTPAKDDPSYKATLVFMSEDLDEDTWGSPRVEKRWIRYDGIGPTDEDGMPFASRSSVDKPREWYRSMFKVLHQLSDSEDSDGEGSRRVANQTDQSHVDKKSSRFVNKPQEQENKPQKSQESSKLHITMKSNVRESPGNLNVISNTKSFSGPAFTLTHSNGPSSLSLNKPAEQQSLPMTSGGPNLTSTITSSTHNSAKHPLQTKVNSNHRYQRAPEPASSHSPSSKVSLQVVDLSYVAPCLGQKEASSPKSPNSNEPYSTYLSNSSSPKRRSTTKMLDQLETDLRQFTEELDRDLEARKQCTASLEAHEDLQPVAQAVVKFDFMAHSEKELSLQRGTKVYILKKVDQNWLLGEQNGRRGLFPESYVKVVSSDQCDAADTPQLSAIALYDFKADSDAEIPLRKGQQVLITRRVGGSWFEGRVKGSARLGLFPASYVQIKDGSLQKKGDLRIKTTSDTQPVVQVSADLTIQEKPCIVKAPASNKLHQLKGTLYQAKFSFSPKNPDELQLQSGDIVTVTEHCEDGWYVGVCWRTQQFGTFPGNFVAPYKTT
ncbi:vinexin [Gastrophryne carolinensis]